MASDPAPAPQGRRSEILAVAAKLFAERGFEATSMRHICGALGISPGNLYHWFPSKQAIVAAFVEADRAEAAQRLAALSASADLRRDLPAALIAAVTESDVAEVRLFHEVYAGALRDPTLAPLVRRHDDSVSQQLADVLAAAGAPDPSAAATVVLVLFEGLMSRRAMDPDFDVGPLRPWIEGVLALVLGPGATR
jgi:AcrR family transcriptional regulator